MANYSLILDTKFKPFSYQEMVAPVLAATQAHQAIEEEYGNLSAKASVWENMANEQTDPYAYKMYKTYSDDLQKRADDLMKYGLNASSRKGMLDMRTRYSKEILPIETAYKRRDELMKEQRNAQAANPTLRYQRMAKDISLDDFIKNPSLDYGASYSGALLTQQVAQAAANYAKVLTEEGKLESLGLPYQFKSKIRHGASPEEILAVINNAALEGHQGAVNFLRSIRDQVLQSSGVAKWADPATMAEFTSFANQGLYSALGQTEVKNYADQFGMQSALQNQAHRHRMAEAREAGRAQAAAMAQQTKKAKMWAFKDNKLIGKKSGSAGEWENYKKRGFITKDGKLSSIGLRNANLGNRIHNYIWQAEHAKTPAERYKYATLAYRAAYGKDPYQKPINAYSSSNYLGRPIKGGRAGEVYMANTPTPYLDTNSIIKSAKASSQYKLYSSMRSIGISKNDLSKNYFSASNQSKFSTAYNVNVGNPVVGQLTHTLSDGSGKELMVSISSTLGNQKVSSVNITNNGTITGGTTKTNLLSLNKDGKINVFVKHLSLVPSSPGTAILTLSNGQKVMLTTKQMNDVFGESITNSLITNSNLYIHGNNNESALGLHNLNEIMGTATTQWGNPDAQGTGLLDFPYDNGQ